MMVAESSGTERITTSRRRGRPRKGFFPPTRTQLLDAARKEAISIAFEGQSGAKKHRDCGSLPTPSHRWFCVQTHPGREQDAALRLRVQDFIVFLPMRVEDRPEHRRRFIRPQTSTPRYLFVAFDPETAPWRRICSTIGVSRLFLLNDYTPAPARRGDVEKLIDWVRADLDGTAAKHKALVEMEPGAVGKVLEGPFAQFGCTFVKANEDGSFAVQVEMFGRSHAVVLERDQVRFG
ncbi:transcription termination/antitermination protein NusG [Roseomonas xinghualingensis]|uniref:transcription termination/antitermination protein NusG n=1 Tax=Roseomonas xinghualingensis TaxID=2986475 RepID=UPI0021F2239B|nr:transcription termination/antitermination NusG family protein [Roseomonas sp. SXEYE001]MCV4209976.1 hypothetical protein [Roseomonas sp. SXEYE001]